MLRALLIALSKNRKIGEGLLRFSLSRKLARRFVAGEELEDAIKVIEGLKEAGMRATLDILGEEVEDPKSAYRATEEYLEALDVLRERTLPSGVSVKLSHIGLSLSENLASENLERIVRKAAEVDRFVRIDMESSQYTEVTIELYDRMRKKYPGHVGIVLQAYLYRTEKDIERLLQDGPIDVRLCKGAYKEPPDIAFPKKRDVDRNYKHLLSILLSPEILDRGSKVALATHDERIIKWARSEISKANLPNGSYEFQMLYGIRRDLQESLVREGERVRIYVPFGKEWYPYFMRRLAERPANLFFLLKNLFRD
jgi:proline dehydrogenase